MNKIFVSMMKSLHMMIQSWDSVQQFFINRIIIITSWGIYTCAGREL